MRILGVGLGLRNDLSLLTKFLLELFTQFILPLWRFDISYATFAHELALRLYEFLLLALAQIICELICSYITFTRFFYRLFTLPCTSARFVCVTMLLRTLGRRRVFATQCWSLLLKKSYG